MDKSVVRLKPHRYKPSKAKLEEEIVIRNADGSTPTPQELMRAAVRDVRIKYEQ